ALQQLVYDGMNKLMNLSNRELLTTLRGQLEASEKAGGGFSVFGDDVNKALAANNADTIKAWRSSPLLEDGESYVDALEAAVAKWEAALEELGFPDATFADHKAWLEADIDWDAYEKLYADEVHIPNRPA